MSDPEPEVDLSRVEPPAQPSPEAPDPRARAERREFRQPKLTPTDRLENALKDHIASLERALGDRIASLEMEQRRSSGRELALHEANRALQADLDRLGPELAELRQARRVAGLLGTATSILMFVGSCLISHAGTLPDGEAKRWYRAFGWAMSGSGVLFVVLILAFGWPPRRDGRAGSRGRSLDS